MIGYVDNGIKETVMRGLILGVGLWSFYLGLGIGNLAIRGVWRKWRISGWGGAQLWYIFSYYCNKRKSIQNKLL